MAAPVDARDRQEPFGGRIAARAGGTHFVCLRSRRDTARDRYRAPRTGAHAGDHGLPYDARVERFTGIYWRARRACARPTRGTRTGIGRGFAPRRASIIDSP